jgi:hypothetical protein
MPRTIPGWSFGAPYNYIEGSFTLRSMQDTPFMVTIAATGEDECGWHAVLGYECEGFVDGGPGSMECEPQYNWVQYALQPIQSRFLASASVTLEPGVEGGGEGCPDLTQVDIDLNAGWNLISLPLIPNDSDIEDVLVDVSSDVSVVWAYEAGEGWTFWDPTDIGSSTLDTMQDGKGYWIYMDAATTQTVFGVVNPVAPMTPPTYSVDAGWNLIGFKSTCTRTASAYLAGVSCVRIWSFDNNAWVPVQSGDMLQPGLGYWIAATGAGTIFP